MALSTMPRGRDLPDPRGSTFTSQLRNALLEARLLDELAATRAERARAQSNERLDVIVSRLGLVRDSDLVGVMSTVLSLPRVREADWPVRPLLMDKVPLAFLSQHHILPMEDALKSVRVAVADPFQSDALAALAFLLERPVEIALATTAEIERAIEHLYEHQTAPRRTAALDEHQPADATADADVRRLQDMASEAPVIRLVQDLVVRAVDARASDIHVEPQEDSLTIRYRIDGVLTTVEVLPVSIRHALTSRIKIMAQIDIAERRRPQDGRIKVTVHGREIDLRISTMPTMHGESVVLRILDRDSIPLDFAGLGFAGSELETFQRILSEPNGIILVTGPTGSGKSTTLYAALSTLNSVERKLFTVEDPIEYQLKGVNQIHVNHRIGLTFASALRSILRQDPDIIMLGEIRDMETAEIAIRASLTGHLVLSTVHTNSAAATITRLLDMGVEDYLLASSLKGVLAQRLVRRLCSCAGPSDGDAAAAQRIVSLAHRDHPCHHGQTPALRTPKGCPECRGTGYRGRTAIYELMRLTGENAGLIRKGASEAGIEVEAACRGMPTLLQSGIQRVLAGETTLEEVLRVTRPADAALSI